MENSMLMFEPMVNMIDSKVLLDNDFYFTHDVTGFNNHMYDIEETKSNYIPEDGFGDNMFLNKGETIDCVVGTRMPQMPLPILIETNPISIPSVVYQNNVVVHTPKSISNEAAASIQEKAPSNGNDPVSSQNKNNSIVRSDDESRSDEYVPKEDDDSSVDSSNLLTKKRGRGRPRKSQKENNESKAIHRKKQNRIYARNSRQKKKQYIDFLQYRNLELMNTIDHIASTIKDLIDPELYITLFPKFSSFEQFCEGTSEEEESAST
ncbi:hypothetical protein WA158_002478 [Blastocystis sp. Blastoise]